MPRLKPVKPIPPRLELLVSWLLAKQARERPPSMRHVADEMNAVLQDTLGLDGSARPNRMRDTEAAILGAAAENLTPAVMADEGELPGDQRRARARRNRSGHLAQVDELRAQVVREQRTRNRRRGWIIAAVLVLVAGAAYFFLPEIASQQKVDVTNAQRAHRTDRSGARGRRRSGRDSPRKHTELTKRTSRSSIRAPRRSGAVRISPPRASRSTTSAACSTAANTSRAPAPLTALEKTLTDIEAKRTGGDGGADIRRQTRAHRRRIRERAPGISTPRSRSSRATSRPPRGSARSTAASGVVPTLADAENAEDAKATC